MIEKRWLRVQLRFESRENILRVIIPVLESVARIRLLKTENPSVCV
jgi:hypothetical protein